MRTIIAPISNSSGPEIIANLQAALISLGFVINQDEINNQKAGPDTIKAVRDFQQQNNVRFNDVLIVDDITAAFFNRILKDKNLLDISNSYTVSGRVLNAFGEVLGGVIVIAFDVDLHGAKIYKTSQDLEEIKANKGMQLLGESVSQTDGSYSITFTGEQFNTAELGLADVVVYSIKKNKITGRSLLSTITDYRNGNLLTDWDVTTYGTSERGISEFSKLSQQINYMLSISEATIIDLFDSPDQVAFLASEIQENTEKVELFIKATELAQSFPNNPEAHALLYGLGRQKITLTFPAIALTQAENIINAWQLAGNQNIIDVVDERTLQTFLLLLHQTASVQMLNTPQTEEAASLVKTLNLTSTDVSIQTSFLNASRSFTGTAEEFWTKYLPSLPEFSSQPQLIKSLQLTNQLVALTANHIPLVEALQIDRKIQTPADLLAFADNDWDELLKKSGIPDDVVGNTNEEKFNNYKDYIQAVLNAAYPSQKVASMLTGNQLEFENQTIKDGLTSFFTTAKNFDIKTSRISDFEEQLIIAAGDNAPLVKQNVARLQRLYSVSPTADAFSVLMNAGFHSANQIANIPQQTFIDMHSGMLGGPEIALAVHERASFQTMRIEKLVSGLNDMTNAINPQAILPPTQVADIENIIQKNIPNWTTLFNSPDICDCEECRSVYGASAFLVDILQFLGKLKPNFFNNTPLFILLQRRPDIAFLPLTCENTNTLIPYIDLVNEIMEYYVAQGSLDPKAAYDTGDTTADELRANPQNTIKEAYRKLKNAIYPFSLPYHQPLDVERIYYKQMRTSRAEVMTVLQEDFSALTNKSINAELLNLSQEEYRVITGGMDFAGNNTITATRDYFGKYVDDNDFLSKIYKVPEFLQQTGLDYTDVVNLLLTNFINPGQPVLDYIESLFASDTLSSSVIYQKLKDIAGGADPSADSDVMTALTSKSIDAADFKTWVQTNFPVFQKIITLYQSTSKCDLGSTELRTLQSVYENQPDSGIAITDVFPKIHRFIRLWNKLLWSMFDLDTMIISLGEPNISDSLIDKMAAINGIIANLNVPLNKLATIWGNIQVTGKASLYNKLFLNRTIQKIDTVFQADRWGAYLSDSTALLKDHLTAIQAAYRVSSEDLNLIFNDTGLLLNTTNLSLENLSIIYRYIVLPKALGISIADLITIKKLFKINPFSNFDPIQKIFIDILPQSTLDFVILVTNIKSSGFKISALNYIIGDIANPQFKLEMPEETVQNTMLAIRKGFLQVNNDHPDSDLQNNITEDFLRSKMQLIYQQDIVNSLINILNGSGIFTTVTDKNIPITIPAPQSNYITYIKGSGRFQCIGVLNNNDKILLNGLSGVTPDFLKAVQELYEQSEQFLEDNFSSLFGINMTDALANLLNHPPQVKELTEQDKLNWFYKNFLPYLKNVLRQNILIQSMATVIGLDEPSTQILLQSQTDYLIPLLSQTGLTATYFTDETFTTAGLTRTDKQMDFSWGVDSPDPVIPADHFSVRWEGYMNPPNSGDYTLMVKVADTDDAFKLFVGDQILLQKNSGDPLLVWEDLITLSMSRSYKLTLEYTEKTGLSGIQLYWKTDATPKKVIETTNLFPKNVYTDLSGWLKKYQKAALLIIGFKLKVSEISHLINFNTNFSSIDFNNISKDHWQRIFNYTNLRNSIITSSNTFIDLFELANRNSPAPLMNDVLDKINLVTGWNLNTLTWLVQKHFNFQAIDFKNEIALLTLLKAIKLVIKTGVAANALAIWSAPETDFDKLYDQSQEIKKAVKAKYEDEDWLSVAKKLSDLLRENQKYALIPYLLVQPELIQWGVSDADALYEYFLIDVQMGACMDTSRIVQATAAVQLFITRCILNLESKLDGSGNETGVQPNQIDQSSAIRWQWMQYYRVWEANRKVFLYPENWLDPELRDDKSPFFKELESELLQNDITQDSVDTAFYNYLNKLDEVSHLDICGIYEEDDGNGNMMTLHVFGRTHGKSHTLYYRTCNQYFHWSAWEKVSVDVKGIDGSVNSDLHTTIASGVHLTPVFWKNRLFIFWPEFLKKQPDSASGNSSTFQKVANGSISSLKPDPYWEISLAWSEYKDGKWTPKNVSGEFLIPSAKVAVKDWTTYYSTMHYSYEPDLKNYTVTPSIGSDEKLKLSLVYQRILIHGQFILNDIHNPLQTEFTIDPNFFKGFGGASSQPAVYPDYTSFFMQLENSPLVNLNSLKLKGNKYLQSTPNHKIIFSPQNSDFENNLNYPFFYRDDSRSYFIRTTDVYYLRTIEVVKNPGVNKYIPFQYTQYVQATNSIPKPVGYPGPVMYARSSDNVHTSVITAKNDTYVKASAMSGSGTLQNEMTMTSLSNQLDMNDSKYYTVAPSFAGNKKGLSSAFYRFIFDKGLTFYTNYHPYSQAFIKALNTKDIDGLMQCDTALPDDGGSLFENTYLPNHANGLVQIPNDLAKYTYYKENVAFDEYSLYGLYNWELFYHAPLYIATRLSKNGKYQEAMKWFHYIFDPTTNETSSDPKLSESRYWKVLPFKTTLRESLLNYFDGLQPGKDDPDIEEWKDNPFKPFLVARNRPIAFMKNVVMKYIDNLIAWGDDLYRTDTRENINTAIQLYIIAAHILGPKPQAIPSRGKLKAETYNSLQPKLDDFSNAMVDLENLFPYSSEISVSKNPFPGNMLGVGSTLYFCIPNNDRLLKYWDIVGDRLFKIRHCMNIDGIERSLALFAPPIDPGLLIKATSSGLSIGSILADMNSPAPLYRFNYLVQKATEFCSEVKALGNALQIAIEKKENEDLARIRAGHETTLLNMITQVKERQILEAKASKQNLEKSREETVMRIQYYLDYLGITNYTIPAGPKELPDEIDQDYALPDTLSTNINLPIDVSLTDTNVSGVKIIPKEKEQLDKSATALNSQLDAIQSEIMSGFLALIPELNAHATPLGVGVALAFGGKALSWMASSDAKTKSGQSASYSHEASKAATMATYIRRNQEITQQANQSLRSLAPLDKQILAANIRLQIAEKDLMNHQQQIVNAKEIEDYLQNQLQGHSKFSSEEFYVWMKEQLFSVYKQSYQMAFDIARRAEKAYQFELGNPNTSFIQYGYFDSTYQGLTAGEQLHFAIKQMEKSFIEQNKREFELTKHISLAMTRPDLLLQLKQTGSCEWIWPEELFDLDYPGHYFRRIKSISISIPCVAGPYITINATLRLLNNSIRINTARGDNGYEHNSDNGLLTDDDRFAETKTPFVAIATSSAQNDSGMFELNFRDERYLPFEGAGVMSKWKLELNGKYLQDDNSVLDISQYDFNSVSDIIVHIHYTSLEDAGQFRQDSLSHLQDYFANIAQSTQAPLMQYFGAKQDLPNEWYQFLHPVKITDDQVFLLNLDINRFPFFVQKKGIKITSVELIAESNLPSINGIQLISPEPTTDNINLVAGGKFGDLLHGSKDFTGGEKTPGAWIIKNPAANARLNENNVSNFVIIVHFEIL